MPRNDRVAMLWDGQGKELATLAGHTGSVVHAAFSPDGSRIVTASRDKTARLWDSEGKQLAVLAGHTGRVVHAAFSPDGRRIVTASRDETARLWDSEGKQLAVLEGHTGGGRACGVQPRRAPHRHGLVGWHRACLPGRNDSSSDRPCPSDRPPSADA